MTDAATTIEADPDWLPHRIDPELERMQFLRILRRDLGAQGFLADRKPARPIDEAWLPLRAVMNMRPQTGPIHFLFHTAFCRSTLLVRALDGPGTLVGLNEPGILASLVNVGIGKGRPEMALVRRVVDLLSRTHPGEAAVIVKPTNHANALMPMLLSARPQSTAVLMTNALPAFLAAVVRKEMMGRRWARLLYLELQAYAGMDFGMDGREQFVATDLQVAALAWFLNQRWFALQQTRFGDRLRVLDGDRFDAERARTIEAVGEFVGVIVRRETAEEIATDPIFTIHSKSGGDFAVKDAADTSRSASPVTDEEIAQVGKWIGMIAQQAGLIAPVRQTLF